MARPNRSAQTDAIAMVDIGALATLMLATLAMAAVAITTAHAEPPQYGGPSGQPATTRAAVPATADAAFLREALEDGRQEVAKAREVMTRTSREDVRSTAQMLMTEHMNMNAAIETLGAKKGWKVAPPSQPPRTPAASGTSGDSTRDADLDSAFIRTQIQEHERNIERYRRQSTTARDADVRELAVKAVPRLEQHLAALKKLDL
jgi:putative membrane protein